MISIVIPSWNGLELLKTCLPAVMNQDGPEFEIIVVDNGSRDGSVKWLQAEYPDVVCISLSENRGFSGAVNQGILAAGDNDVILLNNDTEPDSDWLRELYKTAFENPDYHLFSSRVLLADHREFIDTIGDGFTVAGFGYKKAWLQRNNRVSMEPEEVFGGSGCALYIRRQVMEQIGLFDEDFFAFGEDLDFSFRARLAGFKVMTAPSAVVYHAVRATSASENTLLWYHRNLIWLLIKNLPWPLAVLYLPHIFLHVLLVLGRSIVRGWFQVYAKSLAAAFQGSGLMLKKRRKIQNLRRIPLKEIRHHLDLNWPGVHLQLHRARTQFDQWRSNSSS